MSRIRGTRRKREDTGGHEGRRNRVPEDTGGTGRTREDTIYAGFGTVRPRGQIPGPRPNSYSKSALSGVVQSRRGTAGAQFRREPPSLARAVVTVVSRSELVVRNRRFLRRLRGEGPTVRTVRHSVQNPKVDQPPQSGF